MLSAENQKRFEDDVDALVVDELPEKSETIDRARMLASVEIGAEIDLPVRDRHAFFRRQTPVHISFGKELGGKDEDIAFAERRLQPGGAQGEEFRPQIGKALVARNRRRRMTQLARILFHHLTVGHADGHHLVEGHADDGVQAPPERAARIDSTPTR